MIESIEFEILNKFGHVDHEITIPINEVKYFEHISHGHYPTVMIYFKNGGEIEIFENRCEGCHEKLKEIFKEKQ